MQTPSVIICTRVFLFKCLFHRFPVGTLLALGDDFRGIWESKYCPVVTKKRVMRTVIEEVIVNLEEDSDMLEFTIHWK